MCWENPKIGSYNDFDFNNKYFHVSDVKVTSMEPLYLADPYSLSLKCVDRCDCEATIHCSNIQLLYNLLNYLSTFDENVNSTYNKEQKTLAATLTYKGSVNSEDELPLDKNVGDMYNIGGILYVCNGEYGWETIDTMANETFVTTPEIIEPYKYRCKHKILYKCNK